MAYQELRPVSARTVHYEALCRPQGMPPDELFARAHAEGYLLPLGRLCRRHIACHLKKHPSFDGRIWINIEPAELRRSLLTEPIVNDAGRLVFEITERGPIDDEGMHVLSKLAVAGARIAIDDLGLGDACLTRLNIPQVSYAKVPRELVLHLLHRESRFVEAILERCKSRGIQTVAEGLETHAQAVGAMARGFDWLQGYFFHRPELAVELSGVPKGFRRTYRNGWVHGYCKTVRFRSQRRNFRTASY